MTEMGRHPRRMECDFPLLRGRPDLSHFPPAHVVPRRTWAQKSSAKRREQTIQSRGRQNPNQGRRHPVGPGAASTRHAFSHRAKVFEGWRGARETIQTMGGQLRTRCIAQAATSGRDVRRPELRRVMAVNGRRPQSAIMEPIQCCRKPPEGRRPVRGRARAQHTLVTADLATPPLQGRKFSFQLTGCDLRDPDVSDNKRNSRCNVRIRRDKGSRGSDAATRTGCTTDWVNCSRQV